MRHRLIVTTLLLCAFAANAQPPAPKNGNGSKGFRTEFLADVEDVQSRIMSLAAAVPAEKYSWRPAEGVRSISEVYTHIAGGNYFMLTFLGVPPPAGMPEDIEKITDKAKVIAELQKSFDHLRATAKAMSEAELEKPVTIYGRPSTQRGVYVMVLNHLHEHLGQSIAYARMNKIVPPWSANEKK